MNKEKSVVDYHELNVAVEDKPGADLLEHLKSNILGTPGALRYMHTQTEQKLHNLGEAYFLLLRKSGRMLGSVGLCYREIIFSGKPYISWYVRYFAIKAPLKSARPKSKKLLEQSGRGLSLLRRTSAPYLSAPCEKLKNIPQGKEKSMVYAYIESENFQSVQFAQQNDFETVRKFTTFLFSRFSPKRNASVSALREEEKDEVRSLLKNFYSDHTFYMEDNLFYRNDYIVYRENGRIVAGMQANPDKWIIKDMGGRMGRFLAIAAPLIPVLRKYFNPSDFAFIAGDYIFWMPGHEDKIQELFESACSIHNTRLLMTWSDIDSRIIKTLDSKVEQGKLASMVSRVKVEVKVKFNGYEPDEKEVFYNNPTFISAFDAT